MARSTMATLIARVRTLIGDTAGASETFSDDDLQTFLDQRRADAFYSILAPRPTVTPGMASVEYLDFYSEVGNWEDGYTIVDPSWDTVTPQTSDPLVGHWTFAAGQMWPLRITGHNFDVYGACADACTAWAARVALSVDFSTDGQSFRLSQKRAALLAMAEEFRRLANPLVVQSMRSDTTGDLAGYYPWGGGSIFWDW